MRMRGGKYIRRRCTADVTSESSREASARHPEGDVAVKKRRFARLAIATSRSALGFSHAWDYWVWPPDARGI
jgi:hypothetical protein